MNKKATEKASAFERLPEGWFRSESQRAAALYDELQRELPPRHVLYGCRVEVIAHREGTDDILCHHHDEPDRFTVIHLSWRRREEVNELHPWVEVDGSFDDFLEYEAEFLGR